MVEAWASARSLHLLLTTTTTLPLHGNWWKTIGCCVNSPLGEFPVFTCDEVTHSLKLNRSAGPDYIDPEHLRYGGDALINLLTSIFNAIILSGHIPQSLCHGLVIPIPQGLNKDLSNPSNYREITILSNISKVLKKLLLHRISELESPPSTGWFQTRPQLRTYSFCSTRSDSGTKRARK